MSTTARRSLPAATTALVAVLLGASAYEVLVAAGVIRQGPAPGEGAPGGTTVGIVVALALVSAAALAVVLAARGDAARPEAALLAPAAAAFLVAHVYTPDPYYLPAVRRYVDGGLIPLSIVLALAAGATLCGGAALVRRRAGLLASAALILLCGLTAWFAGGGH